MSDRTRRQVLRLCGAAAAASLAGCGDGERADTAAPTATGTDRTTTGTPTPTDTATPTATATDTRTPEPAAVEAWTATGLSGQVDALSLPRDGPTDEPTGPLYATSGAGEIARLDPAAGRTVWTATARGGEQRSPALVATRSAVYARSESYSEDRLANHVEALDPKRGTVRWAFEDRAFLRVAGVVDDVVVLAGEYIDENPEKIGPNESPRGEGRVYGVDRATGRERWRVTVPGLEGVDVASHGVYALESLREDDYRQTLLAFDADGSDRWTVDTGTVNPRSPVATDDLLLAGAPFAPERGAVGRYDPTDGTRLWAAGHWDRGPDDVAVDDGVVHAGAGPFLALDPDGTERYRVGPFGVPEVPTTPETLYDAGGDTARAVDRQAGEIRWRYRPENFEYTHIRAVLADHLAVDRGIGADRTVVLLGEPSGDVVGRFDTPGDYLGAVGAGRRLILGVDSDVVAYDVTVSGT